MNQHTFELPLTPSYHAHDFVVTPSNALAHAHITEFMPEAANMLLLLGPTASGKTHLAHMWAQQQNAAFLNGESLTAEASASYFQRHNAIVLEAIEAAPKDKFFHLLQYLKQNPRHSALFTSNKDISALWQESPDIHSRLKSLPLAQLNEPDDMLLEALFIKGFSDRQLRVDPALIAYLIPRVERSCVAVYQLLQQLDDAALQEKRPITLPLARSVLENT